MYPIYLLVTLIWFQTEIPFKAKDEFEIKFDLSFKQRASQDNSKTVHLHETRAEYERRTSTTPLPFLNLLVKINTVSDAEIKLKVIRDGKQNIFNKKTEPGMEFKIEVGFTDDAKDQISGYKHEILFLNNDKKEVNRILIIFDEEGNYFVNGEKRGKL